MSSIREHVCPECGWRVLYDRKLDGAIDSADTAYAEHLAGHGLKPLKPLRPQGENAVQECTARDHLAEAERLLELVKNATVQPDGEPDLMPTIATATAHAQIALARMQLEDRADAVRTVDDILDEQGTEQHERTGDIARGEVIGDPQARWVVGRLQIMTDPHRGDEYWITGWFETGTGDIVQRQVFAHTVDGIHPMFEKEPKE